MKLAIKGHPTRGAEVIALLEMLGGINVDNLYGDDTYYYYYITDDEEIDAVVFKYSDDEACIFPLEEFLEKFPYKVGDKVYNIIHNENQTITDLAWDSKENEVVYQTNNNEYVFVNYLQPYKEETMEEKLMPRIGFAGYCKDKYIIDLGDYEIKEENGKTYAVRKQPQYPKTYKECCETLRIPKNEHYIDIDALLVPSNYNKLVSTFTKLLICRDAYWKIAGEEKKGDIDYVICNVGGKIISTNIPNSAYNHILSFPTEEMRDNFFENFKELIEICKELL